MRSGPVLLFAAMLSACGSPAPAPEATAGSDAARPVVATPPPATPPAAAPAPVAPGAMPAALRGRWGMGAADCDPARADNKGLMVVDADRLTFYEARATPTSVDADGSDAFVANLTFAGEGQEWTTRTRFVLGDGGNSLVRTDKGWENGVFRYSRCPR